MSLEWVVTNSWIMHWRIEHSGRKRGKRLSVNSSTPWRTTKRSKSSRKSTASKRRKRRMSKYIQIQYRLHINLWMNSRISIYRLERVPGSFRSRWCRVCQIAASRHTFPTSKLRGSQRTKNKDDACLLGGMIVGTAGWKISSKLNTCIIWVGSFYLQYIGRLTLKATRMLSLFTWALLVSYYVASYLHISSDHHTRDSTSFYLATAIKDQRPSIRSICSTWKAPQQKWRSEDAVLWIEIN